MTPRAGTALDAGTLLRELSRASRALAVDLPADAPNVSAARERLSAGVPALAGEPLLSAPALRQRVASLLATLETYPGEPGATIRALSREIHMAKASLDWEALAEVALAARWDALPEVAARLPVSMQAFSVLLDWATRPVLRAAAERVSTVVRETPWERGTCPCCGSLPLLAEIRDADSERGRALRCGRCGWAWDYLRVGCPNCGERDHRHLGYVHVEGEGEYRRIAWCATCGFYLKELATLAPFGVDDLFEIDLATAALDLLAVERGYRRAT